MKKLLKKICWQIGWRLVQLGCSHDRCSIFSIDNDDSPRLGCDSCHKDFGYVSY